MVYLATPAYRAPPEPECSVGFAKLAVSMALAGELEDPKEPWDVEPRDPNGARARNMLFHRFLTRSVATELVSIDADSLVEPAVIHELVRTLRDRNLDVLVPKICRRDSERSLVGWPAESPDAILPGQSLVRMQRIGFGVVVFSRACIVKMAAEAKRFTCKLNGHRNEGEQIPLIVEASVQGDEWIAVDDWFSRTWTALGGTMWLHNQLQVGHVGSQVYC